MPVFVLYFQERLIEPEIITHESSWGRITDLLVHRGLLLSSSYDGSIKSWGLDDLEIVDIASQAHQGERVSCLAIGDNGVLYSGGSDGALRAWDPNLLREIDVICTHDQPIRSLSVNEHGTSLSVGTAEGLLVLIQTTFNSNE